MTIPSSSTVGQQVARSQPRVLIVCDYFPPSARAGGPSRSILGIVQDELERASISVITRGHDIHSSEPFDDHLVRKADSLVPGVAIDRVNRTSQYRKLWQLLRTRTVDTDLLYLNSLFSAAYSIYPLLLMRSHLIPRRAVLLAPRGELSSGALAIKSFKKRVAAPVLRHLTRHLDVTWHASSEHEARDIARFVGPGPSRVLIRANPAPAAAFPAPSPPHNDILTIAFVARMAPIKNFKLLARAVGIAGLPVRLVVAGALEDPVYWNGCRELLDRLDSRVVIDVRDHLADEAVVELLTGADALALPTKGENFGRSIAEALSVGCPVMIPPTTLWTPLVKRGAGWLIDADDPDRLADALRALGAMTPAERSAIRATALSEYSAWWQQNQHRESLFAQALMSQMHELKAAARSKSAEATRASLSTSFQTGATGRGEPDCAP